MTFSFLRPSAYGSSFQNARKSLSFFLRLPPYATSFQNSWKSLSFFYALPPYAYGFQNARKSLFFFFAFAPTVRGFRTLGNHCPFSASFPLRWRVSQTQHWRAFQHYCILHALLEFAIVFTKSKTHAPNSPKMA